MARLEETLGHIMLSSESSDILLIQLTFENVNPYFQSLIHPIRRTESLQYFVRACLDSSPAIFQGMAIAVALKAQLFKQYVTQTRNSMVRSGYFNYRKEEFLFQLQKGRNFISAVVPREKQNSLQNLF